MNQKNKSTKYNVLITGASGFIGANLLEYLSKLDKYENIYLQVRPNSNLWRFKVLEITPKLITHNLNDLDFWKNFIDDNRIQIVIHLAASGGFVSQNNSFEIYDLNLITSVKFLNICLTSKYVKKFISTGSSAEYGIMKKIATESDFPAPYSDYGWSKLSFGLTGIQLSRNTEKFFYHLRLYTIYGPLEHPTRFIPRLLTLGALGKYPDLSSPNTSKDYVYIDDLLNLIELIISSDKKIDSTINVSSGISVKHEELLKFIRDYFEIETEPSWNTIPSRSFDSELWIGSPKKAETIFSWRRNYDFYSGIKLMKEFNNIHLLDNYYQENLYELPK